jgi:hypothetical protein
MAHKPSALLTVQQNKSIIELLGDTEVSLEISGKNIENEVIILTSRNEMNQIENLITVDPKKF